MTDKKAFVLNFVLVIRELVSLFSVIVPAVLVLVPVLVGLHVRVLLILDTSFCFSLLRIWVV